MNMTLNITLITRHYLILCCYGGSPFVDLQLPDQPFLKHKSTHALDLTDWIAVDTSGSELSSTLYQTNTTKPLIPVPDGIPIEKCDLYNLTFTNTEDENLFDKYKGKIECRCPTSRKGPACEFDAQAVVEQRFNRTAFSLLATLFVLCSLAAIIALLLTIMRCGFCDCFGPFRSPGSKDDLDEPMDENTLNRCLELLRAYEQRTSLKQQNDHNRPLISTVSQGCQPSDLRGPPPPYSPKLANMENQ